MDTKKPKNRKVKLTRGTVLGPGKIGKKGDVITVGAGLASQIVFNKRGEYADKKDSD